MDYCTCDCKTMHWAGEDGWLCDSCNGIVEKWVGYSEDPNDEYPHYDADDEYPRDNEREG